MDLLSHFGVSPSIGFHAPLRTWAMMPLSASRVTKVLSLGNFGLWGEIVPDYKTRMWSPWASPAAGGGLKLAVSPGSGWASGEEEEPRTSPAGVNLSLGPARMHRA